MAVVMVGSSAAAALAPAGSSPVRSQAAIGDVGPMRAMTLHRSMTRARGKFADQVVEAQPEEIAAMERPIADPEGWGAGASEIAAAGRGPAARGPPQSWIAPMRAAWATASTRPVASSFS